MTKDEFIDNIHGLLNDLNITDKREVLKMVHALFDSHVCIPKGATLQVGIGGIWEDEITLSDKFEYRIKPSEGVSMRTYTINFTVEVVSTDYELYMSKSIFIGDTFNKAIRKITSLDNVMLSDSKINCITTIHPKEIV